MGVKGLEGWIEVRHKGMFGEGKGEKFVQKMGLDNSRREHV